VIIFACQKKVLDMVYKTQNALLDLLTEMRGFDSDYQLAKYLQVPLQTIRNYRLSKSKMDETMCLQIANELKMEPLQVMSRVRLDGNQNERIERVWGAYVGRLLLVFAVTFAQVDTSNAQEGSQRTLLNIHYAHKSQTFCAKLRKKILGGLTSSGARRSALRACRSANGRRPISWRPIVTDCRW